MLKIKRDINNEYKYNKLNDLVIRGRDKRRSKIYKSFVGSNIMDGRRVELHRVGPELLNSLECMQVLLEFRK